MSKKNKAVKSTIEYDSPCCEPCRESKKTIKKRLKVAKDKLENVTDMLETLDMNYDSKQQAIGSLYMNVRRLQRELRNY